MSKGKRYLNMRAAQVIALSSLVGLGYLTTPQFAWRFAIAISAVFVAHILYLILFTRAPTEAPIKAFLEANAARDSADAHLAKVIAANDTIRKPFAEAEVRRTRESLWAANLLVASATAEEVAARDRANSWPNTLQMLSRYCGAAAILCVIPWEDRPELVLGVAAAGAIIFLLVGINVVRIRWTARPVATQAN
jgi:hypothetical protein